MPMDGLIIVLGAPNDASGKLSTIAIERCEQAIREHRQNPGFKFLLTGGYGSHFNVTDKPHAFYTQSFLVAHGIPEEEILGLVESSNTIEDTRLSKPMITRLGVEHIIVVTSDFHVKRARYIFEREFPNVEIIFSGCSTYLPEADLTALKKHEERALEKLIVEDSK
jgi:uncharacterized SAM-binding protein YcdF (DUF218 family)